MTTQVSRTRRQVLRTGLVAATGGVIAIAGSAGQARAEQKIAQDKIAQAQVQYQTTPKDGNKCSMCVNFEAPNACKIVAGNIDPNGWCIAYAPKES